ncbi:hypothetical protein C2G38_2149988 [Gigaspora rosea]|uniref:Matrin-type domain-containing protein n=1 Tax=Gigaspora rosea TaxID=44941 RepID=A0A397TX26_9GLOM|nr:hypothetical protein C2G38_2149988 [Gigaspora rosea]
MSEFWISQQKHWCQYCRIYIADNKPSRTMHEQGKKHRENHEKFLRDIYRKEHENRKEAAKTKRELERIEKAAMKQYRRDIALEAPGATSSTIKPPTDTTYSTSTKDYGYHDIVYAGSSASLHTSTEPLPAQPVITQTRAPIVEDRGDGTEPVIGEWRPVTPPPLPTTHNSHVKEESKDDSTLPSTTQYSSSIQVDDDDDDDDDPDDLRNFKIVEKSFPIDSHEELDLELVKIKKEEGVDEKSNVVFKKRKFGNNSNKSRNIRKKID